MMADPAQYTVYLGYPRGHELTGRAAELAAASCEWYEKHGRPWTLTRQADTLLVDGDAVTIDGVVFESHRLAAAFRRASAQSAIIAAASAGIEVEEEAQRLWRDGKPDEFYFLDAYGTAVAQNLMDKLYAELRQRANVLPRQSPGYSGWDLSQMGRLLSLIPCPLEALDSGMLRPKKSLLGVFGIL
jgi:hypothetical protein